MFEKPFPKNSFRLNPAKVSSAQPSKKSLNSLFDLARANLKARQKVAFCHESAMAAAESNKQVRNNHTKVSTNHMPSKPINAGSRIYNKVAKNQNSETVKSNSKKIPTEVMNPKATCSEPLRHVTYALLPRVIAVTSSRTKNPVTPDPTFSADPTFTANTANPTGTSKKVSGKPAPKSVKIRVVKKKTAQFIPWKEPRMNDLNSVKGKVKPRTNIKIAMKSRSIRSKNSKTSKTLNKKCVVNLKKAIKKRAVLSMKADFRAKLAKERDRKKSVYIRQWYSVVRANRELKKAIYATIKQLTEDAVLTNRHRIQIKQLMKLPTKKPSKPMSAFMRFVAAERAKTPPRKRQSNASWLTNINAKWAQLSAENKAVYEQQELVAMSKYHVKVAVWEKTLDQIKDID